MEANSLSLHTAPTPTMESIGHVFFFFSESDNFAYQIKVNEVETNMQSKISTLHTLLTPGIRLKGQIFKLCR